MPTISLTVTAEQGQRVLGAFGRYWNLARPATVIEVREFLIRQLKAVVLQQERGLEEAKIQMADLGTIG